MNAEVSSDGENRGVASCTKDGWVSVGCSQEGSTGTSRGVGRTWRKLYQLNVIELLWTKVVSQEGPLGH